MGRVPRRVAGGGWRVACVHVRVCAKACVCTCVGVRVRVRVRVHLGVGVRQRLRTRTTLRIPVVGPAPLTRCCGYTPCLNATVQRTPIIVQGRQSSLAIYMWAPPLRSPDAI